MDQVFIVSECFMAASLPRIPHLAGKIYRVFRLGLRLRNPFGLGLKGHVTSLGRTT
jgi:hypothetical protein